MEQKASNDLYQKYRKIFKYIDTILYNYLDGPKTLDTFRKISIDYDDLKQEIYMEMLPIIEKYDKDYADNEKMHLEPYVKKVIFYKINKILRDNKNKSFIPIEAEQDLEEATETINGNMRTDGSYAEKIPLIHPDLIPETTYREVLDNDEILTIIKSCGLTEIDCKVLELKIIYNYTFEQIQEELGLASRQAVQDKFKRGVTKLKKKYKSISKLFAK